MYNYKYFKNQNLKNEFDKLYDLDNSFLLPPLSTTNTINEMIFRLKHDKTLIQNIYSKNIKKIMNNLNQLLVYKNIYYSKILNIDFATLLSLTWRFVKHYDPECLALFYENFIDIDKSTNFEIHIKSIYHYYKMHMEDKDDLFTINLI